MIRRYSLIFTFAFILSACAHNNPIDPYEPYNRVMYKVNDAVDKAVLEPTAKGYRAAVPNPVRGAISNFFDNLRDVVSFSSNVLRLDIEKASADLSRIGINTSFGLGGLLPMADALQMPNNKNTLGDTFASWGWKSSHYLVLPLSGPSTVRDGIGSVVTTFYSPDHLIWSKERELWSSTVLRSVDMRTKYLDMGDALQAASLDPYAYMRDIYMGLRKRQTGDISSVLQQTDEDIDDLLSE